MCASLQARGEKEGNQIFWTRECSTQLCSHDHLVPHCANRVMTWKSYSCPFSCKWMLPCNWTYYKHGIDNRMHQVTEPSRRFTGYRWQHCSHRHPTSEKMHASSLNQLTGSVVHVSLRIAILSFRFDGFRDARASISFPGRASSQWWHTRLGTGKQKSEYSGKTVCLIKQRLCSGRVALYHGLCYLPRNPLLHKWSTRKCALSIASLSR